MSLSLLPYQQAKQMLQDMIELQLREDTGALLFAIYSSSNETTTPAKSNLACNDSEKDVFIHIAANHPKDWYYTL